MTEETVLDNAIVVAINKAIADVVGAVSDAAVAAATQATAGSLAGSGGNVVEAGQGSQATFTEAANKADVSVPEVIESLNMQALADVGAMSKSNAKLFDVTATALGLATLAATGNTAVIGQMGTDHRDQMHGRQKDSGILALAAISDAVADIATED
jgi:hypothetical protein